jgi:glycosyltransferase involved in cell wall biosynthesis
VNKKKITILIATGIYPPDIGGPATYSKLLHDELPRKGIGVRVLSFGEVCRFPRIFRHFFYFIKVLKRAKKVDIVYAQDPVSVGFPAMLATKILRKKFYLKVVGDYAWEQYLQKKGSDFISPDDFQKQKFDFLTELRRRIERKTAKEAEKIIVPSNYLKNIVKAWGVEENKIKVIYNAFTPAIIKEKREALRDKFKIDEFSIFTIGRLVPWKGFSLLIDIIKDFPDLKLIIAGDGPDRKKLEEKVKKLKLDERVKFTGRIKHKEVYQYKKACDLFILNTGYEGFSHNLLEALYIGIPIITTKVGGNPELIKDNFNGLLVSYNNKRELSEAIKKIINNNDLAIELANNGKKGILNFSKEKMIREVEECMRTWEHENIGT